MSACIEMCWDASHCFEIPLPDACWWVWQDAHLCNAFKSCLVPSGGFVSLLVFTFAWCLVGLSACSPPRTDPPTWTHSPTEDMLRSIVGEHQGTVSTFVVQVRRVPHVLHSNKQPQTFISHKLSTTNFHQPQTFNSHKLSSFWSPPLSHPPCAQQPCLQFIALPHRPWDSSAFLVSARNTTFCLYFWRTHFFTYLCLLETGSEQEFCRHKEGRCVREV